MDLASSAAARERPPMDVLLDLLMFSAQASAVTPQQCLNYRTFA
jgi:hypothetical protein